MFFILDFRSVRFSIVVYFFVLLATVDSRIDDKIFLEVYHFMSRAMGTRFASQFVTAVWASLVVFTLVLFFFARNYVQTAVFFC